MERNSYWQFAVTEVLTFLTEVDLPSLPETPSWKANRGHSTDLLGEPFFVPYTLHSSVFHVSNKVDRQLHQEESSHNRNSLKYGESILLSTDMGLLSGISRKDSLTSAWVSIALGGINKISGGSNGVRSHENSIKEHIEIKESLKL